MTLVPPMEEGDLLSGKEASHDNQPDKFFFQFNQSNMFSVQRHLHKKALRGFASKLVTANSHLCSCNRTKMA